MITGRCWDCLNPHQDGGFVSWCLFFWGGGRLPLNLNQPKKGISFFPSSTRHLMGGLPVASSFFFPEGVPSLKSASQPKPAAAAPQATRCFEPSDSFRGARAGWAFKLGDRGRPRLGEGSPQTLWATWHTRCSFRGMPTLPQGM